MENEKRREAKELLKDFLAHIVVNDGNFFIVDWYSPKTSNMSARFILDIQNGTLIITGDSGDCVANWYHKMTPVDLKMSTKDARYFIEKVKCSTHLYTYDKFDALEDIEEFKASIEEGWEDGTPEELAEQLGRKYNGETTIREIIDDEFEDVDNYFNNYYCDSIGEPSYPEAVFDTITKFEPDYFCDGARFGCRISSRIYLWLEGYQMICNQLRI